MQARPHPRNPGFLYLEKFDMGEDTPMHNLSSANVGNLSSTNYTPKPTILTRFQQKKRSAITQPKDLASAKKPEILSAVLKSKSVSEKKKSQKNIVKEIEQSVAQQDNSPSLDQAKNVHISQDQINVDSITNTQITRPYSFSVIEVNTEIKSIITQAKEKARIDVKKNDKMWKKIAKAVNITMAVETQGQIN